LRRFNSIESDRARTCAFVAAEPRLVPYHARNRNLETRIRFEEGGGGGGRRSLAVSSRGDAARSTGKLDERSSSDTRRDARGTFLSIREFKTADSAAHSRAKCRCAAILAPFYLLLRTTTYVMSPMCHRTIANDASRVIIIIINTYR